MSLSPELTANNTAPLDQPTERLATTVTSPTPRDSTPVTTTQTAAPQRTTSSTTQKLTTTPEPERMATNQQAKTTELRRTATTTGKSSTLWVLSLVKTMAVFTGLKVSLSCDDLEWNYLCSWNILLEELRKNSKEGKDVDRVGEKERDGK